MYRAVTLSVASTTTSYFEAMANALFVVSCTGCLTYVQDEFNSFNLSAAESTFNFP